MGAAGVRLGELVEAARAGRPRAVGRLVSLVENGSPHLPELMRLLGPTAGRAHVVGLTGSPGVGKSTSTTALVAALRARGRVVGVLAVDPSSPFTGGALLGDRVRMQDHATDPGVFIRSMATRGHLGGLAAAAPAALRVLDAAGCDVVLVETVGVGQSEVDVAGCVDTTCVLLAPGTGDAVQVAKAGVLEIADLFVVNKADRDGAQALVRDLRSMLALGLGPGADVWHPPIVRTVAAEGEGTGELLDALGAHREHQQRSGAWTTRRLGRARDEVRALALAGLQRRMLTGAEGLLEQLAEQVRSGALDAHTAAERLLSVTDRPVGGTPGSPGSAAGRPG